MSSKIHKWLALLMVIQILFWFISGFFFAVVPIERVRSEHAVTKAPPVAISLADASQGLGRVASLGAAPGEKIELRAMLGKPVALVSGGEARPRLYDLASGRQLSPIPSSLAASIASRDYAAGGKPVKVEQVTSESPEYRGALPAWRVDFEGGTNRSIYVAADTGAVTGRRSTLWRVYDFLWSLHIMDFKNHEDFNTPLLIVATGLGLVIILTGVILFPSRLGYYAWRRRRQALRSAGPGAGSS
ncbi:MAG TPA: PepSY domain-containing protein [Allosphingosinicella sp.]